MRHKHRAYVGFGHITADATRGTGCGGLHLAAQSLFFNALKNVELVAAAAAVAVLLPLLLSPAGFTTIPAILAEHAAIASALVKVWNVAGPVAKVGSTLALVLLAENMSWSAEQVVAPAVTRTHSDALAALMQMINGQGTQGQIDIYSADGRLLEIRDFVQPMNGQMTLSQSETRDFPPGHYKAVSTLRGDATSSVLATEFDVSSTAQLAGQLDRTATSARASTGSPDNNHQHRYDQRNGPDVVGCLFQRWQEC